MGRTPQALFQTVAESPPLLTLTRLLKLPVGGINFRPTLSLHLLAANNVQPLTRPIASIKQPKSKRMIRPLKGTEVTRSKLENSCGMCF